MRPTRRGRLLPALLTLIVFFLALGLTASDIQAREVPRVVIIGFDGADAKLVERYMADGHLPNLRALREEGSYTRLTPTNPPQTPVSWSAFATGLNPGKTGIFDFLKREGSTYLPTLAFTTETRKPFLWGASNGLYLGAGGGGAVLVVVAGLLLLFRVRKVVALTSGIVLGGIVGAGLFWVSGYLPNEIPWAINNRQGATMWEIAADNGVQTQVIRVPQNFPAVELSDGKMLSGLGVPDMRGRLLTPSYYTSEPGFSVTDNEFSVEVIALPGREGVIETSIYGPTNLPFYKYPLDDAKKKGESSAERKRIDAEMKRKLEEEGIERRIDVPVTFTVSDDRQSVTIELAGNRQTLGVGEWSDWNVITFPVNWLVDSLEPLRGIARWNVLQIEDELQVYLSPLNFHPETQPIPFSSPVSFAANLKDKIGFYKTLGWAEDTMTISTGLVSDEFFIEDLDHTIDDFERMMEAQLGSSDDGLFVQVFDFTDRIGHLFWRYEDTNHPFHDHDATPEHITAMRQELLRAYQRMDTIVGKARRLAGPDALFMVLSDHGFGSFRRGMNYNSWLVENGFMTVLGEAGETKTLEDLFETRELFQNVDWARTKAYAMGLGGIYINLAGREPRGSVQPGEEYEQVRNEIIAGLEASIDPETGESAVARVYRREEMYEGFDPTIIPDLRVANALNYRIGWQTALGQVPPDIYEDNLKAWSGDHCSLDPNLVKGILFVNRPLTRSDINIIDVMPTVLEAMELEIPDDVDGVPFL